MNRIKQLRYKTGLSQAEFSKEYGMSIRTLTAWENDKRTPPEWVVNLLERVIQDESLPMYFVKKDVFYFYNMYFKTDSYHRIDTMQRIGFPMSKVRSIYISNTDGLDFETWFEKYFM